MRRDWDYVAFGDYEKDMDELSQSAAAITSAQADEIRNLKAMIARLVVAAGGRIEVEDGLHYDLSRPQLTIWRDEANMKTVFVAPPGELT